MQIFCQYTRFYHSITVSSSSSHRVDTAAAFRFLLYPIIIQGLWFAQSTCANSFCQSFHLYIFQKQEIWALNPDESFKFSTATLQILGDNNLLLTFGKSASNAWTRHFRFLKALIGTRLQPPSVPHLEPLFSGFHFWFWWPQIIVKVSF